MTEGWKLLEDQIDCLRRLAEKRYEENSHKGKGWVEREARWHIYKAMDQMAVASYHARNGEYELFEVNMADALNHAVMAFYTLDNDYDGCHPVMQNG